MDFKYYVPDEISALWSKHWQERFSLKSSVLAEKEYHRDWWVKYCVEKKRQPFESPFFILLDLKMHPFDICLIFY